MVQMIYACPLTNSPERAASSANARVVILAAAAEHLGTKISNMFVSNVVPVAGDPTTFYATITLFFSCAKDADEFRDYIKETVGLTM